MNKQHGYYSFDITGALIIMLIVGIVIGVAVWELLKWLWPFVKAWLRAITA